MVGAADFLELSPCGETVTIVVRCHFHNLLVFEPGKFTFAVTTNNHSTNQKLNHPFGWLNFWLENLYRFITDEFSNFSNLSIKIKAFQQKLKSENPEVFALLNS